MTTVNAGAVFRIDGLRRTVADLRRSIDFYCGALGFEQFPRAASPRRDATRLRLGEQHIDLIATSDPAGLPALANAPDPRFQHAAIATCDMAAAWRRLQAHAIVSITQGGPQLLPAHTGGVTAFKFRDPDGHPLELIHFPVGVGDPHWQSGHGNGPTLGIDHFAIVVGAVARSVAFCAERLGLQVAARDVNFGIEQDRLDGVDGVEVDVVSLEPRQGVRTPHLELLHYRKPRPETSREVSPAWLERDEIVCMAEPRLHPDSVALRLGDPDGHRFAAHL